MTTMNRLWAAVQRRRLESRIKRASDATQVQQLAMEISQMGVPLDEMVRLLRLLPKDLNGLRNASDAAMQQLTDQVLAYHGVWERLHQITRRPGHDVVLTVAADVVGALPTVTAEERANVLRASEAIRQAATVSQAAWDLCELDVDDETVIAGHSLLA